MGRKAKYLAESAKKKALARKADRGITEIDLSGKSIFRVDRCQAHERSLIRPSRCNWVTAKIVAACLY